MFCKKMKNRHTSIHVIRAFCILNTNGCCFRYCMIIYSAAVFVEELLMSKLHYTSPVRLCRCSGLVVSFLNSTTRTRPDQTHRPRGSPTSPPTLSGRRLVRSVSTCTDFVRGSGLDGSQTTSVGPCSELWHCRPDCRSETWHGRVLSSLVLSV